MEQPEVEQWTEVDLTTSNVAATDIHVVDKCLSIDQIYTQIGEFGLYQLCVGLSNGLAFGFGSFVILNFVFSAAVPDHRCWIPECEPIDTSDFAADWLANAVPHENGQPVPCSRYQFIAAAAGDPGDGTCDAHHFNRSNVIHCDAFITKNMEHRLVTHLNMLCTGQNNKLPLIGTVSTFGRFVAMPVAGVISDKFGRLVTIVVSSVCGALFSSLQALPASIMSFELYVLLEFLAAVSTTGIIGAAIVLNTEWVTTKYRVRLNTMTSFTDILLAYIGIGLAAWYFEGNFVAFKLSMAVPGFILALLYLVVKESPRWLLTQQHHERAIQSLTWASKMNRKPLNDTSVRQIRGQSVHASNRPPPSQPSHRVTIRDLFKHKLLTFRLGVLSLLKLFLYFAYFGTVFGSTKVHDNKYFSYIIIGMADIPGAILSMVLLDRIGRRLTIGGAAAIYAVLLGASTLLTVDQRSGQLALFVVGKAAITTALLGTATYTTEFWPTAVRNTAINICGTAGRLGSIIASLSVLLVEYYVHLPVILYASAAVAGAVVLFAFLPETVYTKKLPDSIDEALAVGSTGKTDDT